MGYSTSFTGRLDFNRDLKGSELVQLNDILDEDCRDHPAWPKSPYKYDLTYIDLKLTDDMTGLEWSGAEKTGPMEHLVNMVIAVASETIDDFGLTGGFNCQGEDVDDRWALTMADNVAIRAEVKIPGSAIRCPHCEGKVYISEAAGWD